MEPLAFAMSGNPPSNAALQQSARSPFARVAELLAGHDPGKPLISLSLGEPQHPIPDFVGPVLGSVLASRVVAAASAMIFATGFARLVGYEPRTQLLAALAIGCAFPLALSQPYGYIFRARDRMDLDVLLIVCAKVLTFVTTLAALSLAPTTASRLLPAGGVQNSGLAARADAASMPSALLIEVPTSGSSSNRPEMP